MLDPKHPLAELLRRDQRYQFDAYVFVFDALRYGQEKMGLGSSDEGEGPEHGGQSHTADPLSIDDDSMLSDASFGADDDDPSDSDEDRHVTGAELCRAIQRYAIDQYGLLARQVLGHWGIESTSDFGEIVFNLIDIGQMRKTDNDRREDFDGVYEFEEAFGQQVVFSSASARADDQDG